MSDQEINTLSKRIEELKGQLNYEQKVLEIASKFEDNLFLIGCTAIEDKL